MEKIMKIRRNAIDHTLSKNERLDLPIDGARTLSKVQDPGTKWKRDRFKESTDLQKQEKASGESNASLGSTHLARMARG